jgi:lactate permease
MFYQLLKPVGDSLGLSFLVAMLPIVAVLLLLGVLRRPAWQAAAPAPRRGGTLAARAADRLVPGAPQARTKTTLWRGAPNAP